MARRPRKRATERHTAPQVAHSADLPRMPGQALKFVRLALGLPAVFVSAAELTDYARTRGLLHPLFSDAPVNAICLWRVDEHPWGNAGIHLETEGRIISIDQTGMPAEFWWDDTFLGRWAGWLSAEEYRELAPG